MTEREQQTLADKPGSDEGIRVRVDVVNIIRPRIPPPLDQITVDTDGCFAGYGSLNVPSGKTFKKFDKGEAQLNGTGPVSTNFTFNNSMMKTWYLNKVCGATVGVKNTLRVTIWWIDQNDDPQSDYADREFIATKRAFCGPGVAGPVIDESLPRYYEVAWELTAIESGSQPLPRWIDTRTPILLAFDASHSTPAVPVWRSVNLPGTVGLFTLRVCWDGEHYRGYLSWQLVDDTTVLPAVILGNTEEWQPHTPNTLKREPPCMGWHDLPLTQLVVGPV